MDPIKMLKFQAMHKYKKHHQPLMLSNLFLYSSTAIICILFCFSPSWLLPSLASSMKVFVFVSVPKIGSVFLSSKFVFILGNLIVVALIGESKIFSTSSSSQTNNIAEQYERMKRAQTLHSSPIQQQKEPENFDTSSVEVEERVVIIKKTCGDLEGVEEKRWDDEEREEVEEGDDDDDEEFNFLDDDDDDQKLNQRADDFIARVNERRRFELKLDI